MADIEADVIVVGSGIAGLCSRQAVSKQASRSPSWRRARRSIAGPRCNVSGTPRSGCPNAPIRRAQRPITRSATIPITGTGRSGPTNSRAPISRWSAVRRGIGSAPACASFRTISACAPPMAAASTGRITYDDLEPFYSQAEHEIGVSGDSGDTLGSPRSAPYPMPAIPQTFLDKAFARALAGTQFEVRATPQARNSVARGDRPACCGSASCIPICPVQAKYDATVHLDLAEKRGAALHAQTTATRIEVGADRRVAAIRFKRWDGSEGVATGKVFVLAAHAIETPRLLLHSRSEAAAERRRQQLRPGWPQSDGSSGAAELGAGA